MLTTLKNFLTSFLMVAVMAPFLYLGIAPAQKAEAQTNLVIGGVVGVMACAFGGYIEGFFDDIFGAGTFGSIFGSVDSVPVNETNAELLGNVQSTAEATAEVIFKECVLDPIIWVIKRVLIDKLTKAIMDWINDGFDLGPVFVTDINQFLVNLADTAFESFIQMSNLENWLCSPFENSVRSTTMALAQQPTYGPTGNSRCALNDLFAGTGVIPDVGYNSMVTDGDIMFDGGGIPAAMGLASDSNNAYGSLFNVQSEAANRVAEVVSSESSLLSFADGYFSLRCDLGTGIREVCTPGQLISKQIDDWLGGALGQLEVADEVAEVLTEVLAALVNNIFADAGQDGLLSGARDTGVVNTVGSGTISPPTTYNGTSTGSRID